jgi:hypothetical protein
MGRIIEYPKAVEQLPGLWFIAKNGTASEPFPVNLLRIVDALMALSYSIRPTERSCNAEGNPPPRPGKEPAPAEAAERRRRPSSPRPCRDPSSARPAFADTRAAGQLFWDRERHDLERYSRLTERQRRQPYWQLRERQWHKAALLTLMAGGELPKSLARMWAPVRLDSADVGDPIGPRTYAC